MPRHALLGLLLLVAPLVLRPAEADESRGIRWESDVEAALDRAAAEGRPLLLALNALETERANQQLAFELYRSPAWGAATEDWVCLPCNAGSHDGASCSRYLGIPCTAHQGALRLLYRLRRLPPDRTVISPAHAVVDPDGRLLWDKEYFTGVVGPPLFERMLAQITPALALDRAARVRSDEIEALERVDTAALKSKARAWLAGSDALAAAGVIVAADQELDPPRRLALLAALKHAGKASNALVQLGAYEAALFPTHDAAVCFAWLEAALALDREAAFGHVMRAAYRAESDAQRRKIVALAAAAAKRSGGPASTGERAAERELAWLLGRPDGNETAVNSDGDWARRQARARRLGLEHGRVYPKLADLADEAPPGVLRGALLEAEPAEVKANEGLVRRSFRNRREERVRIAAALALLAAGLDEAGQVPPTILAAVFDVVEGEDTRREAVRRLGGDDPGWDEDVWATALTQAVGGAR